EVIRRLDMAMERRRIELRQDEDPVDLRIDAVADRDIDEAILARERHRWLRTLLREGMKASASAAAHDDGKHAFWIGHDESKGGLNLASPLLRSLNFAKQKAENMCGIVGYVGKQKASAIILEG